MATLTAEQRRAVVYRFGLDGGHEGERTEAEVARAMGLDEQAAQKLLAAAMKALGARDRDGVREALAALDRGE